MGAVAAPESLRLLRRPAAAEVLAVVRREELAVADLSVAAAVAVEFEAVEESVERAPEAEEEPAGDRGNERGLEGELGFVRLRSLGMEECR